MINNIDLNNKIKKYLPKNEEINKLTNSEIDFYKNKIKKLLKEKDACLIAHYYVDESIQALAEDTGGLVGDSLEMAKFGANSNSKTIVVAGVRFMGESAKILSPNKKIIVPTLKAECSLDISCNATEFKKFINENPDRTVVVYVNTSAEIKSLADWTVTSSVALDIVKHLDDKGEKILWAPDKYLGQWIKSETNADMIHWNGSCIVHEEFKLNALINMKKLYPDAIVLVHPESPADIINIADIVGSTSQLLKATIELKSDTFIVATDKAIFYKMQQASPTKKFISAPTAGNGATCKSCARCPWMAMNNLKNLAESLENDTNEILIPEDIRIKSLIPLNRMLKFQNKDLI